MVSTTVLALYGPFENIRRMLIGAVLTSSHPWVIKPFYPGSILAKYLPISVDTMSKGTMNTTDYSNVHDNGIEEVPIKTNKYSGTLLIVHDPKRVHVVVTNYINHVGEKVTGMVKESNSIAGINAGGYYDEQGGFPSGMTISQGQYISGDTGKAQASIAFTKQGSLLVGQYTLDELKQLQVTDSVSYGPELVKDGKPYLKPSEDTWAVAPRSIIGQRKDGAILLLALSGRGSNGGIGATLLDCAAVMLENGAYIASNLDGGYSSELYYNGKLVVPPSNPLGERYVATSIVVAKVKSK